MTFLANGERLIARSMPLLAVLIASLAVPVQTHGQHRVTVPPTATCARCSVVLSKLVTVGGPVDTGSVHALDLGVRNARGQVIVAHVDRGFMSVFDARGAFLRTIGRSGMGPGEYRVILSVSVAPGDTLHVFDAGAGRRTVLSPSFAVVRTTRIPPRIGRNQTILLPNDQVLMNAQIRSGARAGLPLHVVDSGSAILRSFGSTDPTITAANRNADVRAIAPSASGGVWSVRINAYVPELWGLDGALRAVVTRPADWFVVNNAWSGSGPPPPSGIAALWEDPRGRLWVFTHVGAADWTKGVIKDAAGGIELGDPAKVYDTVIDVIDWKAGRLVASQRVDAYVTSVSSDGTVVATREDADGHGYMDFFRVSLREPSNQ